MSPRSKASPASEPPAIEPPASEPAAIEPAASEPPASMADAMPDAAARSMPETLMSASSSDRPLSIGPDIDTPAGAGPPLAEGPERPTISPEPPMAWPRSSVMPPASAAVGGRRSRPEIAAAPAISEPAAIESSTRSSSKADLAAAAAAPAPTSDANDRPSTPTAPDWSAGFARMIVCDPACTSEAAKTQSPSSNEPPIARSSASCSAGAAGDAGAAGASRSNAKASESWTPSARSAATRSISSVLNLSVAPSRIGNSFLRSTSRCTSSTLTLSCRAASSIDRNFPAILRVLLPEGIVGADPDRSFFVAPTPPFYRRPHARARPAPPLRTASGPARGVFAGPPAWAPAH